MPDKPSIADVDLACDPILMKWLVSALLFLPASCAKPSAEDEVMDKIEAAVKLPAGAGHLKQYGRSYAYAGSGTVEAIYVIPRKLRVSTDRCYDSMGQPCDAQTLAMIRGFQERQVPAGERRWIDNYNELPAVNDGGCSVITVRYEVQSQRLLRVACNGEA